MSQFVSKTATQKARRVNLYDFLLSEHPEEVFQEGDSLRLRCNRSVSIKEGYCGFYDFSDGSSGNSVDCLTTYFDYEFPDAVIALCAFADEHPNLAGNIPDISVERSFTPPEPTDDGKCWRLSNYLMLYRGFPSSIVQALIDDGLLYQEKEHDNIVFINPDKTFAEMRSSNRGGTFHGVGFSDKTAFWWFKPRGIQAHVTRAYVCEGAIDAISLYLYMSLWDENRAEEAMYCGIAGVANQQRIDRIKADMAAIGGETIMAVDNDDAGKKCRERNADCAAVISHWKDWNEDLLDFMCEHIDLNIGEILNQKVESHRNMG